MDSHYNLFFIFCRGNSVELHDFFYRGTSWIKFMHSVQWHCCYALAHLIKDSKQKPTKTNPIIVSDCTSSTLHGILWTNIIKKSRPQAAAAGAWSTDTSTFMSMDTKLPEPNTLATKKWKRYVMQLATGSRTWEHAWLKMFKRQKTLKYPAKNRNPYTRVHGIRAPGTKKFFIFCRGISADFHGFFNWGL